MKRSSAVIFATGALIAAAIGAKMATSQQTQNQTERDRPQAAPWEVEASNNAPLPPLPSDNVSSSAQQNSNSEESVAMPSPTQQLALVQTLFEPAIAELRSRTQVPVLLPDALPPSVLSEPLYITHSEDRDHYNVVLGITPNCTASVCSVGSIDAQMGGTAYPGEFSETVSLAQGVQGYFQPMSCGASCSLPMIGWSYEGAFYRLSLKLPGSDASVREALVEVANSAIAHGSR